MNEAGLLSQPHSLCVCQILSSGFLTDPLVDQIVYRVSARTCDIENTEYRQIDEGKFPFRHHGIMYIEEGDSHRSNHRNDRDSEKEAGHKEDRAAELTEDTDHKGHVTAQAEYARIGRGEFVEIHHLVQTVHHEEHAKEKPEAEDKEGYHLLPAILGKQEIVKHSSSFLFVSSVNSKSEPKP